MTFQVNEKVEVLDKESHCWFSADITEKDGDNYKVSFVGWSKEWDTTVSVGDVRKPTVIETGKRDRRSPTQLKKSLNKLEFDELVTFSVNGSIRLGRIAEIDPPRDCVKVIANDEVMEVKRCDLRENVASPPSPSQPRPKKRQKNNDNRTQVRVTQSTQPMEKKARVSSLPNGEPFPFLCTIRADGTIIRVGEIYRMANGIFIVSELLSPDLKDFTARGRMCVERGRSLVELVGPNRTVQVQDLLERVPRSASEIACIRASATKAVTDQLCRGNPEYCKMVRKFQLGITLRKEVKSMMTRTGNCGTFELSSDLRYDMELFNLCPEFCFKSVILHSDLHEIDCICGPDWDWKKATSQGVEDERFYFVNEFSISFDYISMALKVKVSYCLSHMPWSQNYRDECTKQLSSACDK